VLHGVIIIIIRIIIIIIIECGIFYKYLCSMLTNDGRCTCEIKCRIAMAKAVFNKMRAVFTGTLDFGTAEEEASEVLHLECSFIWC
jgi:hypothetical protein